MPFERLNASDNVEGTGIGLVISKYLIELMGGANLIQKFMSSAMRCYLVQPKNL